MAKVSVIIPCYNHGQFLDEAVESILGQTFEDFEIVIVDDGSTDPGTKELLSDYSRAKTRVLEKENGHLSSARNHGIERSEGEYILTLDADDLFEKTFLEKAVSILDKSPEIGAVGCLCQEFGVRNRRYDFKTGGGLVDFLTRNRSSGCALFRRLCWEEAGGYDETMKEGYEDWNFWIAVTKQGWFVHSIPEYLFLYRILEESMSTVAHAKRPQLIRKIVSNHPEVFGKHVEQVVYEKECEIEKLKHELDQMRRSLAFRLGRCLTQPGSVLRGLAKRIGLGGRSSKPGLQ